MTRVQAEAFKEHAPELAILKRENSRLQKENARMSQALEDIEDIAQDGLILHLVQKGLERIR